MYLYIKQHVFSWRDTFSVYDSEGNEKYTVKGEIFTFGKKLHVYDIYGNEAAFIEQRIFTFRPKYNIFRNQMKIAEVIKEFTFFKPKYTVDGLGWEVNGNFWEHDYSVTSNGMPVASVSKKWFTFGDAYEIAMSDDVDSVNALAVIIVIDAVMSNQSGGAAITVTNN